MAYREHFLLQFGGTLATPATEIWSCGIRLWSADYGGFNEVGYLTDVAAPALSAWITRPASVVAGHCRLTFAKLNLINDAGHYAEPDTNEFIYPGSGIAGGGGSTVLPLQSSLVMSFTTNDASRGPATKGRLYQPAPAVGIASTGLFTQSVALAAAQSMATLLNTLDVGIAGELFRPYIMSNIGQALHQIDFVSCDTRVDVQRRRANSLPNVYSTVEVLY